MEHSKLPWVVEDVDNMRSNRRPESLEINNDEWNITGWTEAEVCGGVYEQDMVNAAFIVTACNQHDTLKALVVAADLYCKEKLLNDPVRSGRAWYDSEERDLFGSLTSLITKAKELQ